MLRTTESLMRIRGRAIVLALMSLLLARVACAQMGMQRRQTGATQSNQLPLSGRSGQTGSVTAVESAVPGATTSVNTINPSIQVAGPYAGSASSLRTPFSGRLSLRDAVERAIEYNLGAVGLTQAMRQARGQTKTARSALLPNLTADLSETVQQLDLRAAGVGLNSPLPGFSFPTVVGPFNFFDLRVTLSQTVLDLTAWNNYRSAADNLRASELSAEDARDLVVLAAGGAYLQVISAKARVESARAQLDTANALFQQSSQQRAVGVASQIDVNRSQVQALTQQQRLVTLQNDLAKQKINLARLTGLPPNESFDISDEVPYSAAPPMPLEVALRLAMETRADLKAAMAQVRAGERALAAARAERFPSVSVSADYGIIGPNPAQSHGTFAIVGTIRVPIWQGGRTAGNIEQAEAALAQRRAELEDIKGRIESDVRNAYLDLEAATSQVELAQKNIQIDKQNLDLTRQRFDAGVSDNVEVVQAQESAASAQLDYINSVFAHNVAKLSLARAIVRAAEKLPMFLKIQ
jgi:outer membrane protein TolC